MGGISDKHLLCLLVAVIALCCAENTKKDASDNDTVWSQAKTRRLFAREKSSAPKGSQIPKLKPEFTTPARRCGRLMESCFPHVPCCDPCASCRCRLFNTICHCWRMSPCAQRTRR